ncbi:hypothetical protein [Neisseria leonii]|uniref:hypothetical protein n=1 Tax=Neisseria leonii TaxID=2995413 RepID=UPI00237A5417|nr:hypothetical protein [Neisseria sp. 3986]MDD9326623.1 hypothetical protein [Neisseria sp. 3986]
MWIIILSVGGIFVISVILILWVCESMDTPKYALITKQGIVGVGKVVREIHMGNLSDGGGELLNCVFLFKNHLGKIRQQSFMRDQLPTESAQKQYSAGHRQKSRTYPPEKFIRYPRVGEEFEFLYLADNDSEFLILNEGKSEFARHLEEERAVENRRRKEEQQFVEKVRAELASKDNH